MGKKERVERVEISHLEVGLWLVASGAMLRAISLNDPERSMHASVFIERWLGNSAGLIGLVFLFVFSCRVFGKCFQNNKIV